MKGVKGKERARESSGPFEEFWKLYPRKEKKLDARKSWDKVTASVDPVTIIEALTKRVELWDRDRTERQFIPHPTTWLNQGRWEDDLVSEWATTAEKKPDWMTEGGWELYQKEFSKRGDDEAQ